MTGYQRGVFFGTQIAKLVGNDNSFALRGARRFDDPPLIGIFLHGLSQHIPVFGEHERGWQEIEVSETVDFLHSLDSAD